MLSLNILKVCSGSPGPPFTAQNNGDISWVAYRYSGVTLRYESTDYFCRAFGYDRTNRLTKAPFGYCSGNNWYGAGTRYGEFYSYSDDGNFTTLGRHDSTGTRTDSLAYTYTSGTNQLSSYTNSAGTGSTYSYDANGNMVSDSRSNIAFAIYDIDNLPVAVYMTNGVSQIYSYDVNGSRVRKYASNGTDIYYLNDPSGKTELVQKGVYNSLYTYNISGAENIGQVMRNGVRLWRYYYLKDHLGSIRMTVGTTGSVDSYNDLYPYGMLMPGRNLTTTADARYKFTGKERDGETNYDYFGARYYDAKIERWLSTDPLFETEPSFTPYAFASDNPVLRIDPDGRSDLKYYRKTNMLALYTHTGKLVGTWDASNKPVAGSEYTSGIFHDGKQIEPGSYSFKDKSSPHTHGEATDRNGQKLDSRNGSYGEHGIFRLKDFKDSGGTPHDNVGVHSGQEDAEGWETPTYGCIRTTEDAMEDISNITNEDPLDTLEVIDPPAIDSPIDGNSQSTPVAVTETDQGLA